MNDKSIPLLVLNLWNDLSFNLIQNKWTWWRDQPTGIMLKRWLFNSSELSKRTFEVYSNDHQVVKGFSHLLLSSIFKFKKISVTFLWPNRHWSRSSYEKQSIIFFPSVEHVPYEKSNSSDPIRVRLQSVIFLIWLP